MKFVKGLLNKKVSQWTNKKWYHQRFDGCPYFIHFIAEAEIVTHMDRKKKGSFNVHYCFFKEGTADWYIDMVEIKDIYSWIIDEGKNDIHFSKTIIKKWDKDQDLFYKKCAEVGKNDLSKLKDEGLMKLHDDFLQIAINKNSSSSIIDGFALGTDELIAEEIKKLCDDSDIKGELRCTDVFSKLTAPNHLSFINEAEIALLKVANEIKQDPSKKDQLLSNHQKQYFWTSNNYVDDNILSVEHFGKEVENILSLDLDIDDYIKKIEGTPSRNKKEKEELMKRLNVPSELKFLIEVSEDFTYWQDERKKSTFWTTHYFSLILSEISKRKNIPLDLIKYMSPREVSEIFSKEIDKKALEERRKNCVFYWDKEGHDCVHGNEADEVKEKILGKHDLSDVDDFRGLTACMGKAVGNVKILRSVKEINKFEKGDILVSVMTRPDYIPAMKKAAAIVTDEGGVTCHAAIVSRELGIPCIIGTKIATKVLKDNMKVEVNANHSWVRIIK
ncbi:PEP-utilizing enzyme [Nanoarchaeota archaeon]